MVIPVAHDVSCVWCWIGVNQARTLRSELGVTFDWQGFELYPASMPFDPPVPAPPTAPDRPSTPSRVKLALAAQGLELPKVARPRDMRTHKALTALEYARGNGDLQGAVDALYDAYWLRGDDLDDLERVVEIVSPFVSRPGGIEEAVLTDACADRIVPFNDEAYARGVFNVPTFFIGGERYAEQPIKVLRDALMGARATA